MAAELYRSVYHYNDFSETSTDPIEISYQELEDRLTKEDIEKDATSVSSVASSTKLQNDLVKDSNTSSQLSSPPSSSASNEHVYTQNSKVYYENINRITLSDGHRDENAKLSTNSNVHAPTTSNATNHFNSSHSFYTDEISGAAKYSNGSKDSYNGYTNPANYLDAPAPPVLGNENGNGYENTRTSSSYYSPKTGNTQGNDYENMSGSGNNVATNDFRPLQSDGYENTGNNQQVSDGYERDGSTYGQVSNGSTSSNRSNYADPNLVLPAPSLDRSLASLEQSVGIGNIPTYIESQNVDFHNSFSWNERWQSLLERPTMTPEEAIQRGVDINQLTEEFLQVARPIVAKIIEELNVPDDQKTFKPVDVGGIAGGEKFMAKQLFLKHARDNIKLRLYNGDAWAQKAAIHELKSLNALISCNIPNLHFPLMACLSCYGHYIVVVSKLPLNKNTLSYGSGDVARTIKTDVDVATLIKHAAEKLNLAPHLVTELSTKQEKLLYGPVDIEGHKGTDGRSYVVDTARLFPAASPIRGIKGCHLYKLLRKELVRSNPVPLSSDAFSFFGKIQADTHNQNVIQATNRIFSEIIPQFLDLPHINQILTSTTTSLTDAIHERGINVRFLGSLLTAATKRPNITEDSINAIMIEMVARASKAILFNSMRTEVDATKPTKEECRRLSAVHWNYLSFSHSNYNALRAKKQAMEVKHYSEEAVNAWWLNEIIPTLKQRFVFFNTESEWSSPSIDTLDAASASILTPSLVERVKKQPYQLFTRTIQLSGIVFSQTVLDAVNAGKDQFFFDNTNYLDVSDVTDIQILDKRVQYVPFVDLHGEGAFQRAERFYLAERDNRVKALGAEHPQVAITYRHLGELYSDQKGYLAAAKRAYDEALRIFSVYYKNPCEAQTRDMIEVLQLKADLFIKYESYTVAETVLRELLALVVRPSVSPPATSSSTTDSIQIPQQTNIMDKLARVLCRLGRYHESEQLYLKSMDLKKNFYGPEHQQVARTLNGYAQLLFAQNRLSEAKETCTTVYNITAATRGKTHSEVGIALDNLARIYSAEGDYDKSDELLQKALEIKQICLGKSHSFVAMTWDHLASNRLRKLITSSQSQESQQFIDTQLKDIEILYHQALEAIEASLGENHSAYSITLSNIAVVNAYLKKWSQAVDSASQSCEGLKATLNEKHPTLLTAISNLRFLEESAHNPPDHVDSSRLQIVYHAQYAAASDPTQTRIPDKIRKLLEMKGMAVNSANAQLVANLLMKRQQKATIDEKPSLYTAGVPQRAPSQNLVASTSRRLTRVGSSLQTEAEASVDPYTSYSSPTSDPIRAAAAYTSNYLDDMMEDMKGKIANDEEPGDADILQLESSPSVLKNEQEQSIDRHITAAQENTQTEPIVVAKKYDKKSRTCFPFNLFSSLKSKTSPAATSAPASRAPRISSNIVSASSQDGAVGTRRDRDRTGPSPRSNKAASSATHGDELSGTDKKRRKKHDAQDYEMEDKNNESESDSDSSAAASSSQSSGIPKYQELHSEDYDDDQLNEGGVAKSNKSKKKDQASKLKLAVTKDQTSPESVDSSWPTKMDKNRQSDESKSARESRKEHDSSSGFGANLPQVDRGDLMRRGSRYSSSSSSNSTPPVDQLQRNMAQSQPAESGETVPASPVSPPQKPVSHSKKISSSKISDTATTSEKASTVSDLPISSVTRSNLKEKGRNAVPEMPGTPATYVVPSHLSTGSLPPPPPVGYGAPVPPPPPGNASPPTSSTTSTLALYNAPRAYPSGAPPNAPLTSPSYASGMSQAPRPAFTAPYSQAPYPVSSAPKLMQAPSWQAQQQQQTIYPSSSSSSTFVTSQAIGDNKARPTDPPVPRYKQQFSKAAPKASAPTPSNLFELPDSLTPSQSEERMVNQAASFDLFSPSINAARVANVSVEARSSSAAPQIDELFPAPVSLNQGILTSIEDEEDHAEVHSDEMAIAKDDMGTIMAMSSDENDDAVDKLLAETTQEELEQLANELDLEDLAESDRNETPLKGSSWGWGGM